MVYFFTPYILLATAHCLQTFEAGCKAENVMFGRIRLQNNSAFFLRSPRAPRNLSDKLKSAFARSIVGKIQRRVRFENTYKRDVAEVVPFCNHLRADKHVRFAL